MNRLLPPRRLIPKWRKAKFSLQQPDMLGLVKPRGQTVAEASSADGDVEYALHAWERSGSVGDLADLLAFGIDPLRHEQLAHAAQTVIADASLPKAMQFVAREILQAGTSQDEVWRNTADAAEIRRLRTLLRNSPNDVVALVDLAQHYLAHGKQRSSLRALLTAHQISPDSVHVIRAITRFWIHVGQPDRAHAFIKASHRIGVDPWLMASEIATAQVAGLQSTQLRKAQRALSTKAFKSRDITELAGAVGGKELSQGNFKEARKLFRLALEYPTDNVLAQAITSEEFLGIEVDEQLIRKAPNGVFEGRALRALVASDFEEVGRLTECWSQEESFSSRPRLLQSFVHGAMGNFDQALAAADNGLLTDAKDLSLRGNRAYALAALGRFSEARVELAMIDTHNDPDLLPLNLATKGMVCLMQGDHEFGKQLYEEALGEFKRRKDEIQYSDCLAFYARTALRAQTPGCDQILERAIERFKARPSQAAGVVLRSLNQKADVQEREPMRRIIQWEWDPQRNTLVERRGLTAKGAPAIVTTPPSSPRKG